ncbi:MAG: hypothetical protein R3229_12235 [Alphaproteobacteria bacterium]|nr:hypothetical protein [Alphaproteobacteria bacterium]
MEKREIDDLKPAQAKFAAMLAQGLSQTEAYRKTHACKGVNAQRIAERASRLAAKPQVIARVQELLREAKILDIDSVGQAHQQLLGDMDSAREAKNWTALASMHRIRMQVLGMIQNSVVVNLEQTLSDEELIKRLADGDPKREEVFREMLIPADTYRVN